MMMRIFESTWARIGLVVVALSIAVLAGSIWSGISGQTTAFPGMTEQAGAATDAGVIIETRRAVFSGAAVDVEVAARAVDDSLQVAGVSAVGATMSGVAVSSAHIRSDGTALLRFPAAAWPEGAASALLSIREVTVFDPDRGFQSLAGVWDLTIDLPEGDDAAAARTVAPLEPVAVELAGHEVIVEAFLTPSATLVRYETPAAPRMYIPTPTLRAGETMVVPSSSEQRGNLSEVRYGPVGTDGPLTLVFDGVVAVEPLASPWELRLSLAGEVPAESDQVEVLDQALQWEIEDSTGEHPAIRSVVARRIGQDVRIVLLLHGSSWRPGSTPPVVLGDGRRMKVVGAGFSTPDGQPESRIVARLDASDPPEDLVVTAAEREVRVPSTEAVLRP